MSLRRTLIIGFVLVSAIALIDVLFIGPSSFGRFIDDAVKDTDRFGGESARTPDYTQEGTLPAQSGVRRLEVGPMRGANLTLARSAGDQVEVKYTLRVWGRGELQVVADTVEIGWAREVDTVRLDMNRPQSLPAGVQRLQVDIQLAVPDGMDVVINHSGSTRVEGLKGKVELNHASGTAVLRNIEGPIVATGSLGSMEIADITGDVHVEHSTGRLIVRAIDGTVTGSMRMGELEVTKVTGDVSMSAAQGKATVQDVGGDLELKGGIGEIIVADVEGRIKLDASMGAVEVRGVKATTEISVEFGDVEVSLARDGGWTVDAAVETGEIESDWPLTLEETGSRQTLKGTIGDGTHPLTIRARQAQLHLIRMD